MELGYDFHELGKADIDNAGRRAPLKDPRVTMVRIGVVSAIGCTMLVLGALSDSGSGWGHGWFKSMIANDGDLGWGHGYVPNPNIPPNNSKPSMALTAKPVPTPAALTSSTALTALVSLKKDDSKDAPKKDDGKEVAEGGPPFDENGRFIMRSFDTLKPMASFLPGVGGLWGVPMWTFYVNRGQGLATFGLQNKDGGILLFETAEKAYQITPFVGFRTLLKGKRASGATFESLPFFPRSDTEASHPPRRDMYIGNNEMEVEESDPATGIRTNALYFTLPDEDFAGLVRRVTFTNEGKDAVDLEVVDGLARLEPSGTATALINAMGRTLEGWMHVYNYETDDRTAPFFHLVSAPADTADVSLIKDGVFAAAFVEEESDIDVSLVDFANKPKHELLPMICDPSLLFGTDTTLTVPRRFFGSSKSADGTSLDELLQKPQATTSQTPSAFAATKLSLKPGESKTIAIVYGHAPDLDTYTADMLPKLRAHGYIKGKRAAASSLGNQLTERVAMDSGVPLMDGYVKQNYLDNLLRGGMPVNIAEGHPASTVPKIFHAFSRIHGDLERDYNNFEFETSFWSQGPGNFRDVLQNRRCDVLQLPILRDFNVRQFLSYVQADGYNQLMVHTAFFHIHDAWRVEYVVGQLAPPGKAQTALKALLSKPFRPGQLFVDMAKAGVEPSMSRPMLLDLVTRYAEQVPAGAYSQNGFWVDHWTYQLNLVENFLSVFPDEKVQMLYDSDPIPFYLSPGRSANRTEKNMLAPTGVRQYDAVVSSPAKAKQLQIIVGDPNYVGDTAGGGAWQRTADGQTMRVSVIAKLVILCATKFAILDPMGMGLEMEGGKPGWNDAMNGLPALFGSEMPSAYELHELLSFVAPTIDEAGRDVDLPEEVAALLISLGNQLSMLADGKIGDFEYWDKAHDAIEEYRTATDATFTGKTVTWGVDRLGAKSGVLGAMLARSEEGIARAVKYAPKGSGVSPTYFIYNVKAYELLGASSGRGLPLLKISAFDEPKALPLFLEGPTRHLKTLKDAPHGARLEVYKAVAASTLHDTELGMYKISESLKGQPMEIGRMMAFDSGWLENESIWLHMSYKWYLELLRAGLYAQFFDEIRKGVVCFMEPSVFGRSPLEATSFIVSSAFPDTELHGTGFLARLSGTTAEFLSMWNFMMVGATPFTLDADGKLQLSLAPVIASWMWKDDATLTFTFLGAVQVTYVNSSKKNSWETSIKSYKMCAPHQGACETVDGPTVPAPLAVAVRNLQFSQMTITFG